MRYGIITIFTLITLLFSSFVGAQADTTPPDMYTFSAWPADTSISITYYTNEPAATVFEYGTVSSLGNSISTAQSTSHSVELTGLSPGTLYYYQVTLTDTAGNSITTDVSSFETTFGDGSSATGLIETPLCEHTGSGNAYNVGPDQTYESIGTVPWHELGAGDTVRIHWRATPYHEKMLITQTGTEDQPFRVCGVPSASGELPIIDADGATASENLHYIDWTPIEDLALLLIGRGGDNSYYYRPSHIVVENLHFRNARPGYNHYRVDGSEHAWGSGACIYVLAADTVTLRNNIVERCGNGIFALSKDEDETALTSNLLLEGNYIHSNGIVDSYRQHNVYVQTIGMTAQYNRLGDTFPGSLGASFKDRSAGTIVRYNFLEGGARVLDLVEAQEHFNFALADPRYRETHVYGNILFADEDDARYIVHYGGDTIGYEHMFRKGTLYFHHNTIYAIGDQSSFWTRNILDVSTNDENVYYYNNIAHTDGTAPLYLAREAGNFVLGTNWMKSEWQLGGSSSGDFSGTVSGTENVITGTNRPFDANTFAITNSLLIDAAQDLHVNMHPLTQEYVLHQKYTAKQMYGAAFDLGAIETDLEAATPTCSDGILNQDEEGVDCGGSCDACITPTCSDGAQNQDETGIDCGGVCDACVVEESCTDGIQNQDETGVDCGGSCNACAVEASCTDGILNQDETGIDCGGSCAACVPTETLESPTGRNPLLLWTPEQQAIWQQMREEYEANSANPTTTGAILYQQLKEKADCDGCSYGDEGQWATMMYQITGDTSYVAIALNQMDFSATSFGANYLREMSAEYVIMYDWLYPGMTDTERAAFLTLLNRQANAIVNLGSASRGADSDQTTGDYFGIVLNYLVTKDYNPEIVDIFNMDVVGGLTAAAESRDVMRNSIEEYVSHRSVGGQWMEGNQYNLGTMKLMIMGAQGVKTATGTDYFPDLDLEQFALAHIFELTPDLKDSWQWGDVEDPRNLRLSHYRMSLLGQLGGLTKDISPAGPAMNQLIEDIFTQYGMEGYQSAEIGGNTRFHYFYDPYAPKADWRTTLPKGHFASGQGILYYHDDWQEEDSFLGMHWPANQLLIDHQVTYGGDFRLYRNGEWVVDHPLGYNPQPSETANSMIIAGLDYVMREARGPSAHELADDYAYLAGATGGHYSEEYSWNPPNVFLHEWGRSMLYLPDENKNVDTIIVFDRVNMKDPRDEPNYGSISPRFRDAVNAAPALSQWIIHTPASPTMSDDTIMWQTAGGQDVVVHTLLPENHNKILINENDLWSDAPSYYWRESERKMQVRISPEAHQRFDTFLNVVQAKDAGVTTTASKITSTGGEAQGVLLTRPSNDDTLILFNAMQGPDIEETPIVNSRVVHNPDLFDTIAQARILTSGYTTSFTSATAQTDVFIMDLDTSADWSLLVDGSEVALAISDAGIGRATIAGVGEHTLELVLSGAPSCVVSDAAWSTTTTVEGTVVELTVTGTNCLGKQVSFEVFEDDALFDSAALIQPDTAVFGVSSATATWVAEWECDGSVAGICTAGDPEYYFIVTIDGEEFESGQLSVTQPEAASCTDGVQNQDEDGVDCGGVCTACSVPEPELVTTLAQGFGAGATGGRGGQVIHVTNLNADGAGSLQEALNTPGARTIVFDVSGVISGGSDNVIEIPYGDVTIAGQTAPGAGITLASRLYAAYDFDVGNIIVQHVRIRPPEYTGSQGNQYDALQFSRNHDVLLDHISVSFGVDEVIDLYEARDITLQYSTIEQAATAGHPEGEHNYGLINGPNGQRVTVHHNLFAHNKNRNPAIANGPAEVINNVVYNVRHAFVHHNPASGQFNIVGNYIKRGPSDQLLPFWFDDENGGSAVDLSYHLSDNYIDDPGNFEGVVDNPWAGAYMSYQSNLFLDGSRYTAAAHEFSGASYVPVTTHSSSEVYDYVLATAGAFPRDAITLTSIAQTQARTGTWGAQRPADLMEGLTPSSPALDTDGDGMSDAYESSNGLDPNTQDHNQVMSSGYTALEEYLVYLSAQLVGAVEDPVSCTDGVQNQDETGVDCGGVCTACPVTPTCDDGVQNQDETGVDCGGVCTACPITPTCDDGIQNQNEEGIDCGGVCAACPVTPTCDDGVQNQNEEGIDCGGSCGACPTTETCSDGILNQDETGVDCGGVCDACRGFELAGTVTFGNNNHVYTYDGSVFDLSSQFGGSGSDSSLSASPSGTHFVYSSERYGCGSWDCLAHTTNGQDDGPVFANGELVHNDGSAAVNDAGVIVYSDRGNSNTNDLFVIAPTDDGYGAPLVLTDASPYNYNVDPRMSFDGTKIVFACRDGSYPSAAGSAICEVNLDGSGFRIVVAPEEHGTPAHTLYNPTYVGDGIAFTATWDGRATWYIPNDGSLSKIDDTHITRPQSLCGFADGTLAAMDEDWTDGSASYLIKLLSLSGGIGTVSADVGNSVVSCTLGTIGQSCEDGIMNQDEDGIDCGGICVACETCDDGIHNQNEEDVDCGGVCTACPTCTDSIQNQGESGVDCGGPCTACATCTDGIQNQDETGVDCGGSCAACAVEESCTDGIMNQDETDVDCGGVCTACPEPPSSVDGSLMYGDNDKVYRLPLDGTPIDVSALIDDATGSSGDDNGAYASHDGSYFTFNTQRFGCAGWACLARANDDLSIVEAVIADGGTVHPEGNAAITNDGDHIVYVYKGGTNTRDLFAITHSGSGYGTAVELTTDSPYSLNLEPVLSFDENKVVFACRDGSYPSASGSAICEVGIDGTGFRIIVDPQDGPGATASSTVYHPTYTKEGGIAFVANWDGRSLWYLALGASEPVKLENALLSRPVDLCAFDNVIAGLDESWGSSGAEYSVDTITAQDSSAHTVVEASIIDELTQISCST